ncbi:MAG: hypothetical protein GOP50_11845 [Candidatus Heimdallarchaeota archaeon]|nr:hypothetical protein [Candidatus Heimdallarchaeota archaeon]
MKGKKLLFGFSVVMVFILASQFTTATQITLPETTIANETPLTCIEQFQYRVLNLTANHEWLFNMSRICDGECNCTNEIPDGDQLQIRDRIQERLQDCENAFMQMLLNCFRHNE